MKKKSKTPLALRVIPTIFPWLEKIAPPVANRFFARLFFTPIGYPTPEKELKAETFADRFTLETEGRKIRFYQWGKANKTILLVHGWAGRATQFRRFVKPLLAAGYQVVGFDGPAHGKSEGKQTDLNQFRKVIEAAAERYGNVAGIIAHSFGGVASLYAIAEGLKMKTLVNIASPTIASEIITTYLKAVGGSPKTGQAFEKFIMTKFGKPFEDYASLSLIKRVPENLDLMLVHDENDKEVSFVQAEALVKIYPRATLYKTTGLGHTRILRDNAVIKEVVTFIRSHSSEA